MNSDEYHSIDWDTDSTGYGTCKFCAKSFGDHERACPYGSDLDDAVARGREEDRAYPEA